MTSLIFSCFYSELFEENAPEGWVLARFYRPEGRGFELFFLPGGGEFAHQKNCLGGGGMVRLGID